MYERRVHNTNTAVLKQLTNTHSFSFFAFSLSNQHDVFIGNTVSIGKNARDGGKGRRTSRLKGQRRASFGGAVGGLSASIAKAIAATNRTPIEGGAGGVGGGGGGGAGNLPKSLQSAQSQSGSVSAAGTKLQGQHKMLSPRGTGVSSSAPLSPRVRAVTFFSSGTETGPCFEFVAFEFFVTYTVYHLCIPYS